MDLINTIFGTPLGYLMYYCYIFFKNYGIAILVFTFFTKIILFPLSLISQKNSIKMVKIQPQLEDIKQRFSDNPKLMLSEQKALYKKEKYSSLVGMLPLLLQIPLIMGLINVMYNPLQHLIHLDQGTIAALTQKAMELTGIASLGSGAQIGVIDIIQSNPEAFQSFFGDPQILQNILNVDFSFLGINLSVIPSWGNITILVPLLSALSSFVLSAFQNKYNVLQREQGFLGKWGMAAFLVAFSGYFAFVVPAGIGVYWIFGNILSIVVMFICNMIYNPAKFIDYENRSMKPKLTKEEKQAQRELKKREKEVSKVDMKRFYAAKNKQLVFYSEGRGFYKYFRRAIAYILSHSNLTVHYVTSDVDDPILKSDTPNLETYFVGGQALIPFMMKMEADMVIMTMPDLEQYHIKRSILKKDIEYIYLDHGMASFHLMLREGALDYFDTIFCYGPNHIEEIRQTEEAYNLPPKKLVKTGFALLDELLESVEELPEKKNEKPQVLIAPSWQKDSIMEFCLDELLAQLLHRGNRVILRPHPEFIKRFPAKMDAITSKYKEDIGEDFIVQTDFSSNSTVYLSDVVITDWSSIAQEFSYTTKKPSLFINTPMKIMNPNYKKIKAVPLEISTRDEIGVSVDVEEFDKIPSIIDHMVKNPDEYKARITKVLEDNIYYIGESAKATGDYVIETLLEKQKNKAETQVVVTTKAEEKKENLITATVKVNKAFLKETQEQFEKTVVKEEGDAGVTVEVIAGEKELFTWLFEHVQEAELLAPQKLRESVETMAKLLVKKYTK